jgi:hypothetical protein
MRKGIPPGAALLAESLQQLGVVGEGCAEENPASTIRFSSTIAS